VRLAACPISAVDFPAARCALSVTGFGTGVRIFDFLPYHRWLAWPMHHSPEITPHLRLVATWLSGGGSPGLLGSREYTQTDSLPNVGVVVFILSKSEKGLLTAECMLDSQFKRRMRSLRNNTHRVSCGTQPVNQFDFDWKTIRDIQLETNCSLVGRFKSNLAGVANGTQRGQQTTERSCIPIKGLIMK
jgi:hypothetical protein